MTNPNDPISPVHVGGSLATEGLTKREYFAAKMYGAMVAAFCSGDRLEPTIDYLRHLARTSINAADALINELNKREPG